MITESNKQKMFDDGVAHVDEFVKSPLFQILYIGEDNHIEVVTRSTTLIKLNIDEYVNFINDKIMDNYIFIYDIEYRSNHVLLRIDFLPNDVFNCPQYNRKIRLRDLIIDAILDDKVIELPN